MSLLVSLRHTKSFHFFINNIVLSLIFLGTGKTTFIRMLAGKLAPDSEGTVEFKMCKVLLLNVTKAVPIACLDGGMLNISFLNADYNFFFDFKQSKFR